MDEKIESDPVSAEPVEEAAIVATGHTQPLSKARRDALGAELFSLQKLLKETATPAKMKKWILDICEANDVRVHKDGSFWTSPNWEARIKGWDRVASLLGYTNTSDARVAGVAPSRIMIQVVNQQPPVIEKKDDQNGA